MASWETSSGDERGVETSCADLTSNDEVTLILAQPATNLNRRNSIGRQISTRDSRLR